ncbi:hypothetical protein PSU4_38930 [Pseudonocardia sulfidoxydans NBRC 16205]|uniref:Putative zinc-finger domain-containing protein n=2 Tax=Pseudonocardia sulfidoxydans TaxID=54011 RepID=A0A511DJF3_9PSEU|nr:hypothetical protein PSU4_38930 [Pseudonocardia sulfidoxydans NBRC 16205]
MRLELGAYLLGSLAPAERVAVDSHLATCADCRAELASLAPLPGLLGRLTPDEAREGLVLPPADLLPRTLVAVGAERRRERRTVQRWRLLTAAAAVAALAGLGITVVPMLAPGPASTPMAAVAGVGASGSGVLEARAWGTALQLTLSGLPPAGSYQAFATAHDGHTEVVASWGPTPSGRASIQGATAIQRADLAEVQVRTVDGRPLMSLPC